MTVRVLKSVRELRVVNERGETVFCAPIALGADPVGPKKREGDGKTPEGRYGICVIKEAGRHGQSLGLSYPGERDAEDALREGRIDGAAHAAISRAHRQGLRPPWGTPLGGEIYIHAGGTGGDWTQGCIALEAEDMAKLFALRHQVESVEILP